MAARGRSGRLPTRATASFLAPVLVLAICLTVWLTYAPPFDRAGTEPSAAVGTALRVAVDRDRDRATLTLAGRVRRSSSDAPVVFRVLGRTSVAAPCPMPSATSTGVVEPPTGSVRVGWQPVIGPRPGVALRRGRVFRSVGSVALPGDGALRLCVHLLRTGARPTVLRSERVVASNLEGKTPLSVAIVPIADAVLPWVRGAVGLGLLLGVALVVGRVARIVRRRMSGDGTGLPPMRPGVRVPDTPPASGRPSTHLPRMPPGVRVPDAPPNGPPARSASLTDAPTDRETPDPAAGRPLPDPAAGRSALNQYERRLANWRAKRRTEVGAAGETYDPDEPVPQHITAWKTGADGEATAAARFAALREAFPHVVVLHDRRESTRARANIDHVLVGPAGVIVADTKAWSGDVAVRDNELFVNRRRQTQAALDVLTQVAKVRGALERGGFAGVPVFGALHWTATAGIDLSGRLAPRGVPLLDAAGVLLRADAGTALDAFAITAVVSALELQLPPAVGVRLTSPT
ncbi:nuclease-related domain-containing protein [Patulibacter sp.]|uniref:nuclease-related domain-containing protein n=1 Tax=Patulibacter sp. TaxID=1912859 RepID=UPI0027167D6E|nr:nuclease-related domain-containing protein [Patulibacter sp.]MDO9410105.1 nuclease-related domain-containing protein [Patulibacter sp.]